jgi:uncharacterized membrane protein YfcA
VPTTLNLLDDKHRDSIYPIQMNGLETFILLIAALVTSGISAVLGMAGGVTLISLMAVLLPAAHVVPLHGVIQLASNSTRTMAMWRYVRWRFVFAYAPLMLIGVWLATMLWSGEKMDYFRPAIGALVLLFLFWRRRVPRLKNMPLWIYPFVGLVIGFATIFVGATGPLGAPFFYRDEFSKEEVIGTHAVCMGWGHALKIPAFISLGFDFGAYWQLLVGLILCVICGTLLGRHVLFRISTKTFRMAFETILGLIALYLIGSWVYTAF